MLLTHASHPDPFQANGRSLTYDTMHQAILISRLRRLNPERRSYECPNTSVPRPRDSLLTSRTSFALTAGTPSSRLAKLVRDARRYCQSGSDRLVKQPTDPATAGRKACLFRGQDMSNSGRTEFFHQIKTYRNQEDGDNTGGKHATDDCGTQNLPGYRP